MTIDALKLEIINKIMRVSNAETLKQIEESLTKIWLDNKVIQQLNKPMRKKLDLEELKKEQNYKPVNLEEFHRKIEELNIEESLDDLLEMI